MSRLGVKPSDLLNGDKFDALQHPLFVKSCGLYWPVYDIDVASGATRIDVMGLLQIIHFPGDASGKIRDGHGVEHDPDDFYNEEPAGEIS